MSPERFTKTFELHGLPPFPVESAIVNLRYVRYTGDWHCETETDWWYLDGRYKKEWVPSGYGPTF